MEPRRSGRGEGAGGSRRVACILLPLLPPARSLRLCWRLASYVPDNDGTNAGLAAGWDRLIAHKSEGERSYEGPQPAAGHLERTMRGAGPQVVTISWGSMRYDEG